MSSPKESAALRAGEHLRQVRLSAGITQDGMAALMRDRGFKWIQTTVTKTEAGTRPLMLDEFVGLCEALDLQPGLTLTIALGPKVDREVMIAAKRARLQAAQRELDEARTIAHVRAQQLIDLEAELERLEPDAS